MNITSTDAKNRFGQVLDEAQKRPVVIEKSGRRHSVLMSAEHYDRLVARAAQVAEPAAEAPLNPQAQAFAAKYKAWVDEQHRHFEQHGIWNEEFRTW
ncbi:type II toxin-antitoxin system Phd/YefM family antitoxin [Rubrivivax albus]|uniref:Antitoxin n=1 Tax=Rubrivivax albus TaxID=2499835 RepID=A0A437K001_9BURK|nr:type II toxin-antitoxin system Phd/YefM family antitoxin [Rubrivivax albus]RVT53698.1 type II toxin-antitoxin system Phd/YefM family antitoxin [Rubrivivax albus]